MIRTKQGAIRRYNALLNRYRRDFAGGGMFGCDWPTLRLNSPSTYTELRQIKANFATLPDRKGVKS